MPKKRMGMALDPFSGEPMRDSRGRPIVVEHSKIAAYQSLSSAGFGTPRKRGKAAAIWRAIAG